MRQRGLMRWNPWGELDRFFEDDAWQGGDFTPSVDVRQDKDNVIVEMPLAGVDPEKVDISIENDVLTVSGRTEEKKEVKREDYYHKEIREGSFSRSVILPMPVKGTEAQAESNKGMLTITVPKAEEAKPKKIAVQVKSK